MLTRRRFLAISAAAVALPAQAQDLHVETGLALGARVTLRLHHPDAPHLAALAMAELRRLEAVFSLYQPGSALLRLNRQSRLDAPPFELLECLSIVAAVHRASGGRFDPTVQPLWRAEAEACETGRPLTDAARGAARDLVGWSKVGLSTRAITLRPGMALTLNGIAQGYIADRVAGFLAGHGLSHALIDTGEFVALPGGAWPVRLAPEGQVALQGRALATSAPLGMTFGNDGARSHILDPLTGGPVRPVWAAVSVSARSAALADALSTAGCLTASRAELRALLDAFDDTRLESAIPA